MLTKKIQDLMERIEYSMMWDSYDSSADAKKAYEELCQYANVGAIEMEKVAKEWNEIFTVSIEP